MTTAGSDYHPLKNNEITMDLTTKTTREKPNLTDRKKEFDLLFAGHLGTKYAEKKVWQWFKLQLEEDSKWRTIIVEPKSKLSAFVTGVKLGRIFGFKLLKITLKNSKEKG